MAANDVPCCEPMFWVYLVICVALVCFAGLMSGLTLGLMSLSLVDLEVIAKAGQPQERRNAEKILPLVKKQHLLLCTLLIYNAMAMEALPIFLDSILPAWVAILISVTLILAFGEIIPQAVCSRYGLSVGARLSVLVRLLVLFLLPISYPISKLLDWILGKGHAALLGRSELKTFVDLHSNQAGKGGELTHEETTIIGGALELTQKTAKDAMTPMSRVFALDINAKLDKDTMELIMRKGHSRVPIYSGSQTNIIGLILVKNLIDCRPEDETPIRNLMIRRILRFDDNLPLYNILSQFQRGHSHMGIVVKSKDEAKFTADKAVHPVSSELRTNTKPDQLEGNKINNQAQQKKQKKIRTNSSNVHSTEAQSRMNNLKVQGENSSLLSGDANTMEVAENCFVNPSEEIMGIIALEDVMEELLQDEILDETDEYIDVHNNIKINMLPATRSSPQSSEPLSTSGSTSHMNRTPMASPHSSCHNSPLSSRHPTPLMQSPTAAYIPSPLIRPTLLSSPIRSRLSSPGTYACPVRSSPSSHRVSVNSYERLEQHGC